MTKKADAPRNSTNAPSITRSGRIAPKFEPSWMIICALPYRLFFENTSMMSRKNRKTERTSHGHQTRGRRTAERSDCAGVAAVQNSGSPVIRLDRWHAARRANLVSLERPTHRVGDATDRSEDESAEEERQSRADDRYGHMAAQSAADPRRNTH